MLSDSLLYTVFFKFKLTDIHFATNCLRYILSVAKLVKKIKCRCKDTKSFKEKKNCKGIRNLYFYASPMSLNSYLKKYVPYQNISNTKYFINVRTIFTYK